MLLAALPGLPRPVLSRLTAAMIDQLDRMDGDPDFEPEQDCCQAYEDRGTIVA